MIVFDLRIFQEELASMNQPTMAFQHMMSGQLQQKGLEEQPLGVGE